MSAQEPTTPPLRVIYEDEGETASPPEVREILRGRLAVSLGELGFRVQEEDTPAADLLLIVGYETVRNEVRLRMRLYDTQEALVLAGSVSRGRAGLTLYNTVDGAVEALGPGFRRYLENRYIYVPPINEVESITFRSRDEGAQVFFGGALVGSVYDGTLRLPYTPFAVGSRVRVDLEKEGHHGISYEVTLREKDNLITLRRLPRRHRYGVQLLWTTAQAQGIGVGFRYYLFPDYTFLQLERSFSLQGELSDGGEVYHNDLSLLLKQYVIFPHNSVVRLNIGAGVGTVFSDFTDPDLPEFADLYVTVASLGVELNLDRWAVFFRPQLRYAPGLGDDSLLGRQWLSTDGSNPPLSIGVLRKW